MAGPSTPAEADPNARGGQFVTEPGFATPGQSSPSYSREAPGSTVVYSPKGWKWEKVEDDYALAVSKVAQGSIEGALRQVRTTFGSVFYIKGTAETSPPFDGEAIGDTCRVQDAVTNDIVAEWKWTGVGWERAQVSSAQISNLDVGKLTAGSAAINEIAARKIASDVGRFLELTTEQLTVSGTASFNEVMARTIWTQIVTATEGEFEKIQAGMIAANSISADKLQVGALDGQVITGATVQTNKFPNRGLKIHDGGMQVFDSKGWKSLDIDALTGTISIEGRIGRRDTWSEVYFTDLVSRDSKTDEFQGQKHGCGLAFNSLEDDWWDGTIALTKDSTGDPAIRIQAPIARASSWVSPYIAVSPIAISMYTPNGNSSFSFNSGGLSLNTGRVYMWMNDQGMSFGTKSDNKPRLYVGVANYNIRPTSWDRGGLWGNNSAIVMEYDGNNQVWIGADGVHITNGKKFSMRVPRLTAERGGLWLDHSCTESPYDGIEYWEQVTLDGSGQAVWVLPDYVPAIASKKAPWIVLTGDGASARLDRSGDLWEVHVTGTPGSEVPVLVKGARMIDSDTDPETNEPIMRDYARESPWRLGPPPPPEAGQGGGYIDPPVTLGGGLYGPAPKPESTASKESING